MKNIIILGIGNKLMMDDGIGVYLVEELSKTETNPQINYVIGESDIDYSLSQLEGAEFVIILDAVLSGSKPGDLTIFPLDRVHSHRMLDLSPHNLHLFQALYYQRDKMKGFLIGIEPSEISFQMGLSRVLSKKWPEILYSVKKTIEELL
ncbi:hydrogenase maturation protease [Bacillus sp. ISL-47]|uniref:hydrogenase maturation protease n=1 Tax=Bacillus sp. ISL-47 TaxID=2819130 RepID=UPI001BEA2D74|nr:hydrogenase maturation protease [Bacillus sp. ISL-47]MBT2689544.1 hydrogenase maturation protease [Bacillus sp. ISL-47]MBT2708363.1 hydrogenase maturation protease [Pseudomonas sp. ISL-84]